MMRIFVILTVLVPAHLLQADVAEDLRRAEQIQARAKEVARKIIQKIPKDATQFSLTQYTAIQTAGALRDELAAHHLVDFVAIKYSPPKPPAPNDDDNSPLSRLRRIAEQTQLSSEKLKPKPIERFQDYPAAQAMLQIGDAQPIVVFLENNADSVKAKDFELYAKLLARILAHHTVPYLQEERRHARRDRLKVYDRLLEMPVIKQTHLEFWRGGPVDPEPDPFGPTAPVPVGPNVVPFGEDAQK